MPINPDEHDTIVVIAPNFYSPSATACLSRGFYSSFNSRCVNDGQTRIACQLRAVIFRGLGDSFHEVTSLSLQTRGYSLLRRITTPSCLLLSCRSCSGATTLHCTTNTNPQTTSECILHGHFHFSMASLCLTHACTHGCPTYTRVIRRNDRDTSHITLLTDATEFLTIETKRRDTPPYTIIVPTRDD